MTIQPFPMLHFLTNTLNMCDLCVDKLKKIPSNTAQVDLSVLFSDPESRPFEIYSKQVKAFFATDTSKATKLKSLKTELLKVVTNTPSHLITTFEKIHQITRRIIPSNPIGRFESTDLVVLTDDAKLPPPSLEFNPLKNMIRQTAFTEVHQFLQTIEKGETCFDYLDLDPASQNELLNTFAKLLTRPSGRKLLFELTDMCTGKHLISFKNDTKDTGDELKTHIISKNESGVPPLEWDIAEEQNIDEFIAQNPQASHLNFTINLAAQPKMMLTVNQNNERKITTSSPYTNLAQQLLKIYYYFNSELIDCSSKLSARERILYGNRINMASTLHIKSTIGLSENTLRKEFDLPLRVGTDVTATVILALLDAKKTTPQSSVLQRIYLIEYPKKERNACFDLLSFWYTPGKELELSGDLAEFLSPPLIASLRLRKDERIAQQMQAYIAKHFSKT